MTEPETGAADTPAADAVVAPARPLLTVLRGDPTPEQLAALVAVVGARAASAGDDADEPPAPTSLWSRPQLRTPLHPGPGAWRASGLPQ